MKSNRPEVVYLPLGVIPFEDASNPFFMYDHEENLINARDFLVRGYRELTIRSYTNLNNPMMLYFFDEVTIGCPIFNDHCIVSSNVLSNLEYALKFRGPKEEFPENVNAIIGKLGLTKLKNLTR